MPDRGRAESPDLADALDRYWDAILDGASDLPTADFDPGLAATVQRMHALESALSPHPVFASTLWEELMSARAMSSPLAAQPDPMLHVRPLHEPGRWLAQTRPQSLARLAAALLLIVLLAGSAFAALYPLRMWDNEGLPLFAPLGTPSAEPAPTDENVLVDFTVTDIEPFTAEGSIAITDYPAGGSSRELAGKESPEIFYIAAGPMTMSVEAAPQPVRVIPPRGTESSNPEQALNQDAEIILETGSVVFLPEKAIVNLLNPGPGETSMIDLLWATESYSTEAGNARWVRVSSPDRQEIVPPTRITLRQTTIAPDEVIAGSSTDNVSVSVAAVAKERRWNLRPEQDGGFGNRLEDSIDVYVLQVESGSGLSTPSAAMDTPSAVGTLEFLWDSNGGPDPMVNPYGVGADLQGNVWVSDGVNDRFQIFAPDGSFLETWGESGFAEGQFDFHATHGNASYDYGDVAFDEEGNIYVADTGNFRVQKFAPDRSFLQAWGGEGTEPGQMMAPGGIAVGPDGTIYVVDENRSDVQMFTTDGALLGAFGEPGAEDGQFSAPAGIATDIAGDVWVADFGNNRIQRFSPDGEFLAAWGTLGAEDGALHNPNDVAIDAAGRVYVADLNNYRLQVLTPDGDYLADIGGMGGEPGQFFTPNAVAVAADGVAYVSDNYRVQAFQLLPAGGEPPMP